MTSCADCRVALVRPEAGLLCPDCFEKELTPTRGIVGRAGPAGLLAIGLAMVPSLFSLRSESSSSLAIGGETVASTVDGVDYVAAVCGPLGTLVALGAMGVAFTGDAASRTSRAGVAGVALLLALRATVGAVW